MSISNENMVFRSFVFPFCIWALGCLWLSSSQQTLEILLSVSTLFAQAEPPDSCVAAYVTMFSLLPHQKCNKLLFSAVFSCWLLSVTLSCTQLKLSDIFPRFIDILIITPASYPIAAQAYLSLDLAPLTNHFLLLSLSLSALLPAPP